VARDWEKEDVFHQVYHSFFVDLIENVLTDTEQIVTRARHLNVPFRREFRMIVIPLNNSGSYSAGRLGAELIEKFSHGKIILYHQQIILLDILQKEYSAEQTEAHKEIMSDFLIGYDLNCGISATFKELTSMHIAYEQCIAAMRYSTQVNEGKLFESPLSIEDQKRGEQQRIFDYDDMISYCMIDTSAEGIKLWRESRYSKALYSLHEQDQLHGTNNLQLLYVWLSCERRIALTSELMHMHRNSVAYRIDKIEDMIGIDLNNHHERLKLMLSFSLMRLSPSHN